MSDVQPHNIDTGAITQRLRVLSASALDCQVGYQAGVDDYLTKKAPDIALSARLHPAFAMHALRVELRATQHELAALRGSLQAK